mgnify:CR=1 FL=1
MVKPEWGKKRICTNCKTKYYDFNKSPIICPSCGSEFDPDIYLRTRKSKNLSTKVTSEKNKKMNEESSDIDDIDTNEEVIADDDPLIEINKENQDMDAEVEIDIGDDISFIDEDDINGDDVADEDIIDQKKQ